MRNITEINKELFEMQKFMEGLEGSDTKDITILSEILLTLAAKLARSANLVAEASMISSTARRKAYLDFSETAKANGLDFSPSIIKDFVSTQCGEQVRCAEYADRINAALTHTLEAMRSIISAAKTEFSTLAYARS